MTQIDGSILSPTPPHRDRMRIVIIGLTITSSWGNGHATTYRGLVRELVRRGHEVLFLEHDKPWYASNRDMPRPPFGRTALYASVEDLKSRFEADVRDADVVIVGSYVPRASRSESGSRAPPVASPRFTTSTRPSRSPSSSAATTNTLPRT